MCVCVCVCGCGCVCQCGTIGLVLRVSKLFNVHKKRWGGWRYANNHNSIVLISNKIHDTVQTHFFYLRTINYYDGRLQHAARRSVVFSKPSWPQCKCHVDLDS